MKRNVSKNSAILCLLVLLTLFMSGCSLQLVAPFDARTEEQIFNDARLVDQFYGELQETPEQGRSYQLFGPKYREIEVELRSLVLRNKVRKLNEDSTEISQKILDQWGKCKERHKKLDAYKDAVAELDRDRFRRMFEYAARAEGAKIPAD
ncbi:hypothetical protein OR1_01870 [Geobacter sp. OR-1]|uniref:hypothetical protein n=1 Tax=Geobacter sp. OR-1 TaxID=1266765 RepID=UPI0005434FDC|nr:hypothetical protein [Geobacter sp. OR-1]GAM09590.1 hypothetical protein OR1_01870 [Geobacter sp. OR-1]